MSYELINGNRSKLFSDNSNESRRFMIQTWYPANPDPNNPHAPWMVNANIYAPAIAEYLHLLDFLLDHFMISKIPAFLDAPLAAEGGYPVILSSHGWNGFASYNHGQAIALASHGYIVISLQYAFGACDDLPRWLNRKEQSSLFATQSTCILIISKQLASS